jgi:hypothetical protein
MEVLYSEDDLSKVKTRDWLRKLSILGEEVEKLSTWAKV